MPLATAIDNAAENLMAVLVLGGREVEDGGESNPPQPTSTCVSLQVEYGKDPTVVPFRVPIFDFGAINQP